MWGKMQVDRGEEVRGDTLMLVQGLSPEQLGPFSIKQHSLWKQGGIERYG